MFEALCIRTESLGETMQLSLRLSGPTGIVLHDADGGVEALVQRWVALKLVHRSSLRCGRG